MPLASDPVLARIAKGNRDEWFFTPKNDAIGMQEGQPLPKLHRHLSQNLCWELATSQMTERSRQWVKDNTLVIAIRALNLKSIQQFQNENSTLVMAKRRRGYCSRLSQCATRISALPRVRSGACWPPNFPGPCKKMIEKTTRKEKGIPHLRKAKK